MKQLLKYLADIELTNINIHDTENAKQLNPSSWKYLITFFQYHELLPVLYYNIKNKGLKTSPEVENFLKQSYYSSSVCNIILLAEFIKIKELFDSANIRFAPLKGIDFLNSLYPDINLRSIVDIDILLDKNQLSKAETLLLEKGYKKNSDISEENLAQYHCHFTYSRTDPSGIPLHLELHWALDYKRNKNLPIEKILAKAKRIVIKDVDFLQLSPEDILISLVLHQRRFHKPLILKNVLDAKLLLQKTHAFNWDYVIKNSWEYKFRSSLSLFLKELEIFYGYKITDTLKNRLGIWGFLNKFQIFFLKKYIYNPKQWRGYSNLKLTYIKLTFLLYDSFIEAASYIIFIPKDKFIKLFGLSNKTAQLFYRMRIVYAPWRILISLLNPFTQV